jgi:predicted TIM-barrel enzyme
VVTGPATGVETDPGKILEFRRGLGPGFPLIVGAGVNEANLADQLAHTDGAIVGSWFKRDHVAEQPLEPAHVARFMDRVRTLRGAPGAAG